MPDKKETETYNAVIFWIEININDCRFKILNQSIQRFIDIKKRI